VGTWVTVEHFQNDKCMRVTFCLYQAVIYAGYHCEYLFMQHLFCSAESFVRQ